MARALESVRRLVFAHGARAQQAVVGIQLERAAVGMVGVRGVAPDVRLRDRDQNGRPLPCSEAVAAEPAALLLILADHRRAAPALGGHCTVPCERCHQRLVLAFGEAAHSLGLLVRDEKQGSRSLAWR